MLQNSPVQTAQRDPNFYPRELSADRGEHERGIREFPLPCALGDILIGADGYRYTCICDYRRCRCRVERPDHTVADLVTPGDLVAYKRKGGEVESPRLVVAIDRVVDCVCPLYWNGDKYCSAPWVNDGQPITKYHAEVVHWSITITDKGARPSKSGKYRESQLGWINECVAVGNRILFLFENNSDEVIVVQHGATKRAPKTPRKNPVQTAQQLALDLSLPPVVHPWRCTWCNQSIATPAFNTLAWCYRDKRKICDACYERLLETQGVRVCRDCPARPNCRYLQEPEQVQPQPSPARRKRRARVRRSQDVLFDLAHMPCSICGHIDCGHTNADCRYYYRLARRVLPHRRVSVAPALSELAWESYSGDRIMEGQPIRKPFLFEGKSYCNTGGSRQEFEGYLVVERSDFHERTFRYNDDAGFRKTPWYDPHLKEHFAGDQERHAPKGYYHGMRVKRGGKEYVLAGPPVGFVVEE